MRKRKILFTTGIRSDFYIQEPVMDAVRKHPNLDCQLVVAGAHHSKKHGNTINEIKKKKYKIVSNIKNLVPSDHLSSRIKGAAIELKEMIKVLEKTKPDIIVAPYDREEAMTVALAGTYMHIPVAHLGAGDNTRYNVDGIIRHSVSKLSHLAFVATKGNADRLIKMGEEKNRVFNVGSTSIDRFKNANKLSREEVGRYFDLDLRGKPLIVNLQHPVSDEAHKAKDHIGVTLKALDELNYATVIIYPNSDPGSNGMAEKLKSFSFKNKQIRRFRNLPEDIFVNLMRQADCLVGNSSMGVIEAPALKLPVVNVGKRQQGRENAGNIIFVPHQKEQIKKAVQKSLFDKKYQKKIKHCKNPYGRGAAGEKIARILARVKIDNKLLNKRMTY